MANIKLNPIRWQIDSLSARVYGVISTKDSYQLDLTRATSITGITLGGSQPPGTYRYVAFKLDGKWGKLTAAGAFQAFGANNCTIGQLEENGNTPAQLTALTNIPAFVGKRVGVAIGLIADDPANAVPTATLSFKCVTSTQQLAASRLSPLYELGEAAQIIELQAEKLVSGNGSVDVSAQATYPNGGKSEWKSIASFTGEKCSAIQFRADYRVPSVGSKAEVSLVSVLYSDGSTVMTGLSDGEIYTKTFDWYMPLHYCRLTINHAELRYSTLRAYAVLRGTPNHIKGETLGVGTGGRKTFQLSNKGGILYDSFKLYYDGVQHFIDFELNSEAGRVTCAAPSGVIVSCDYEYGWDSEDWREMKLSTRYDCGSYWKSEYRFEDKGNEKSLAALKVVMGMTSGRITGETLGVGAGISRSYRLSRQVRDGGITIYVNNAALATRLWRLQSDNMHVTITASAGASISATYDWISEAPIVSQFAAVFAE